MISKGSTPVLTLVEKGTVDVDYPREEYYMPSLPKREKLKVKGIFVLKRVLCTYVAYLCERKLHTTVKQCTLFIFGLVCIMYVF